ncbi:hypothetical protein [Streptosporangium pseudovulgare]|uniref:NADH:flavin oxidoreductase/NADH oxidase N-terminal domain-containing protein n=1 Tax=Streptosporangium pseudovulgare TaxID=35765 RepID=A0ABQ2QWH9_9ACTN|nr:hypothetical protein [Streptosporangium pseudovulgare]GGQ00305.1 hypothetical protein GCM10010140_32970 [Streptosporangium pseudovulgare]
MPGPTGHDRRASGRSAPRPFPPPGRFHPDRPRQTDRTTVDHRLGPGADLVSFGRAYIADPDLVERLRQGLPIAPHDRSTWYQGGDEGAGIRGPGS